MKVINLIAGAFGYQPTPSTNARRSTEFREVYSQKTQQHPIQQGQKKETGAQTEIRKTQTHLANKSWPISMLRESKPTWATRDVASIRFTPLERQRLVTLQTAHSIMERWKKALLDEARRQTLSSMTVTVQSLNNLTFCISQQQQTLSIEIETPTTFEQQKLEHHLTELKTVLEERFAGEVKIEMGFPKK